MFIGGGTQCNKRTRSAVHIVAVCNQKVIHYPKRYKSMYKCSDFFAQYIQLVNFYN